MGCAVAAAVAGMLFIHSRIRNGYLRADHIISGTVLNTTSATVFLCRLMYNEIGQSLRTTLVKQRFQC